MSISSLILEGHLFYEIYKISFQAFEKHPELPPAISSQAAGTSMLTSCAVTGFATKRGTDSGWASQLEDVPKGHKIQGVGTKTQGRDFNFERR